jgi:2,5-dihydroxypyridine 5,6-dioxygenase
MKMNPRIIEMLKYARVPFELNAKPGEQILIIADTTTDPLVWQALAAAANELETEVAIVIMTPRPFHQAEPPPTVAEAMKRADITLLVPSKAILHSRAVHEAMKAGRRFVAMEEITADMLTAGAATANYPQMQAIGQRILKILNEGKNIRVTSKLGTDLRASIEGRNGFCVAGIIVRQPGVDLFNCAFPDGEAGISPIEGTGEGTVVWDTTMHYLGRLREPVKAVFKKGVAVDIQGGEAQTLVEIIRTHGDANSYNLAEISIGINPMARVTGLMREDKKLAGSVHVALGSNADTGGTVRSKLHIDGVIRKPTVYVDGNMVVEEGSLKV